MIAKPTYLIAELGGDVVELVRSMRSRFNPDNVLWPADITIAGSSGVGTLEYGQSLDEVIEIMTPIIAKLAFTKVVFTGIERFPNTGIYYLNPIRDRFDEMHKAIVLSGLAFSDNPWPYNPHCTLHWKDENTAEIEAFFKTVEIPSDSFIDCFSLYQPQKRGGTRAYKF